MQHDIIDNRERRLADSIKPLLSESERAKFEVGYFFISGFKVIAAELEQLKELRLLVGNVSDHQTVEQLADPVPRGHPMRAPNESPSNCYTASHLPSRRSSRRRR